MGSDNTPHFINKHFHSAQTWLRDICCIEELTHLWLRESLLVVCSCGASLDAEGGASGTDGLSSFSHQFMMQYHQHQRLFCQHTAARKPAAHCKWVFQWFPFFGGSNKWSTKATMTQRAVWTEAALISRKKIRKLSEKHNSRKLYCLEEMFVETKFKIKIIVFIYLVSVFLQVVFEQYK